MNRKFILLFWSLLLAAIIPPTFISVLHINNVTYSLFAISILIWFIVVTSKSFVKLVIRLFIFFAIYTPLSFLFIIYLDRNSHGGLSLLGPVIYASLNIVPFLVFVSIKFVYYLFQLLLKYKYGVVVITCISLVLLSLGLRKYFKESLEQDQKTNSAQYIENIFLNNEGDSNILLACKELMVMSTMNSCIEKLAIKSNDPSICNEILCGNKYSNGCANDLKYNCYLKLKDKKTDELCEDLYGKYNDRKIIDLCIISVTFRNKNVADCEEVSDDKASLRDNFDSISQKVGIMGTSLENYRLRGALDDNYGTARGQCIMTIYFQSYFDDTPELKQVEIKRRYDSCWRKDHNIQKCKAEVYAPLIRNVSDGKYCEYIKPLTFKGKEYFESVECEQ